MSKPQRHTDSAGSRTRLGDRGDTSVEMVLYAPLMLLAVTVVVQAVAWGLADLSARHAANHALQTARVHGATAEDGRDEAFALLDEINPRGITNVTIDVTREAETTTVTVTGDALQVVPLVTIPISVQAHGPTEPAD